MNRLIECTTKTERNENIEAFSRVGLRRFLLLLLLLLIRRYFRSFWYNVHVIFLFVTFKVLGIALASVRSESQTWMDERH